LIPRVVSLLFPRTTIVCRRLFSNYLQRASPAGLVLAALGFFILPHTRNVYAWDLNSDMPTTGVNLFDWLVAVLIDLGGLGSGARRELRG